MKLKKKAHCHVNKLDIASGGCHAGTNAACVYSVGAVDTLWSSLQVKMSRLASKD